MHSDLGLTSVPVPTTRGAAKPTIWCQSGSVGSYSVEELLQTLKSRMQRETCLEGWDQEPWEQAPDSPAQPSHHNYSNDFATNRAPAGQALGLYVLLHLPVMCNLLNSALIHRKYKRLEALGGSLELAPKVQVRPGFSTQGCASASFKHVPFKTQTCLEARKLERVLLSPKTEVMDKSDGQKTRTV